MQLQEASAHTTLTHRRTPHSRTGPHHAHAPAHTTLTHTILQSSFYSVTGYGSFDV